MKSISMRPEIVASALCLLAVVLLSLSYVLDRPLYMGIMGAVSIQAWDHPFIDWEWVPSSVQCFAQGVNVYLDNTCYTTVPHVKFSYSPLMLRATFLPTSASWTNAIGLATCVLFSLSILLLRAPRTGFAVAVLVLTTISGETAFALERANVDVMAFLLAVAGVWLWSRTGPARAGSYFLFIFGGLMKFYPLVLLLLAMRETRRAFLAIALTAGAVLAVFVWLYAGELVQAVHGVPGGSPFFTWIGAMLLPAALAPDLALLATNLGLGLINPLLQRLIWGGLSVSALLLGFMLATRGGVRTALRAMPPRDQGMLLAGSLLMGGCFIAGNSNGYRAVLLILAVPGLLSLSQAVPSRAARACFVLGCLAAPFVMWAPAFKNAIYRLGLSPAYDGHSSTAGMVHFFATEFAWWWLMGLLLSAVIGFMLNAMPHLLPFASRTVRIRDLYRVS